MNTDNASTSTIIRHILSKKVSLFMLPQWGWRLLDSILYIFSSYWNTSGLFGNGHWLVLSYVVYLLWFSLKKISF